MNVFSQLKKHLCYSNIHSDLSKNNFPVLPTAGLRTLQFLSVKGNTKLTQFPASDSFPQIDTLEVEYPYHCCPFKERTENNDIHSSAKEGEVEFTWLEFGSGYGTDDDESMNVTNEEDSEMPNESLPSPTHVKCTPKPDPFFPCEDLMGDWILRCGVWIVFLLALIGNATVIIVILASHTKMDVSRFLISNLAFADLFMGVYLGFLAVVDVSTFGNFKRYALEWQMSAGCRTAGFLAVLSSELSVFTLTVITLERYIAIKNAIRVNRKLELKTAMIVMAFGWIFAIASASLPLLHINSYSKFSICLPFEIENTQSIAFLSLLLCLNATAFVVILCCYILMYCSIRGSNAWNASDFRVAKRMALLVFTDFACWAPIVFLSLTAAFGSTLVSLNQAKIFTVFVFPLNSCANPFLYAIFTSHFKKDVVSICRRVEDKYPFLKITRHKQSFSRRSSYSGAISENPNVHLKLRRLSLPTFIRGIHSSVETHDKGGSSASTNSNNKSMETNALIQHTLREVTERETSV